MIYHIYANYVKDLKFYTDFHFVKDDKDNYTIGCVRDLKQCKDNAIIRNLIGKQLHYLGKVDDLDGEIISVHPEILLDFDDILCKKEEVLKDGE